MTDLAMKLVDFMREAWGVLSIGIAMFAILAIMSSVLKTAGASILGANLWVWEAIAAVVAVLGLALFAFFGIPAIIDALSASTLVETQQCGPMDELSMFSSMLIAGLVSLRMLMAVFRAVVSSVLGANVSVSDALIESGEALTGMIVITLIFPLTAKLLGVC